MDFIIGLPPSKQSNSIYNTIYIIINHYTKTALYLLIVKTITIARLADLFFNKILYHFKTPKGIIFNYGSIFTNKF